MTLKEQHHKAACDRNLKQTDHGVIVTDFTIRHDDIKNRFKALITFQLPFFDISADELLNWSLETFPELHTYLKDTEHRSFFNLQTQPIEVNVSNFGRNRFFSKCDLLEIQISVVDYANNYIGKWNKGSIQAFLDNAIVG